MNTVRMHPALQAAHNEVMNLRREFGLAGEKTLQFKMEVLRRKIEEAAKAVEHLLTKPMPAPLPPPPREHAVSVAPTIIETETDRPKPRRREEKRVNI